MGCATPLGEQLAGAAIRNPVEQFQHLYPGDEISGSAKASGKPECQLRFAAANKPSWVTPMKVPMICCSVAM